MPASPFLVGESTIAMLKAVEYTNYDNSESTEQDLGTDNHDSQQWVVCTVSLIEAIHNLSTDYIA